MAGIYDFPSDTFVEGDAWDIPLRRKDSDGNGIDLTGLTPKMMLRDPLDLAGAPVLTVNSAAYVATPIATGCYIPDQTVLADRGKIRIFVASADNDVPAGTWKYDVQLTDVNGNVRTFLAGSFPVRAQATT